MKVLLLVTVLVTMTTALKCFEKEAVAVPADGAKQEWVKAEYVDCEAAVTVCHNTTWSRDGADMIQYGCGVDDMCESVNSRKKRSETGGCTISGENITPATFDEGLQELECATGYTGNGDATNKLRYCYNGVAWKSYQYAGEALGVYSDFVCGSKEADLWWTVDYTAASETVPVVTVDGQIVTETTEYLKSPALVVSVTCLYDGYTASANNWPSDTHDADVAIADLTVCAVDTGFALVDPPVVIADVADGQSQVTATVTDTSGVLPQGLSEADDTNVDLTCEKGALYNPANESEEAVELVYGSPDGSDTMAWYLRSDTEKATELSQETLDADYELCFLDPSRAILAVVPEASLNQRLCADEDCTNGKMDPTAVDANHYVVCEEGYSPPENDADWGDLAYVLLTFTAVEDASTLQFGSTDWSESALAACVEDDAVVEAGCLPSVLTDLHLSLYDTDGTTEITETSEMAHGETVVAKCDGVGYQPGFLEEVELHTYQCNAGSWGTIYTICAEFTDCTTVTCAENACNSSTGMFAGLSLLVGLLFFLTI